MAVHANRPLTPGRRKNAPKENDYFEPGKFGRKTGITLKDTGVRDEYGLEPVDGIFSSPALPSAKRNYNTTLSSDRMATDSSAPEPTEVLNLRKTPHLPPKSPGPRRSHIGGSPMRHASLHPGSEGSPIREVGAPKSPNRLLNFSRTEVVASIEKTPSPFKGRTGMGEKRKGPRKSIFEFNLSPEKRTNNVRPEQQEQRPDTVNQTVADDVDDRTAQDAEDSLPGATNEDLTAPDMDNSVGVIQAPDVDESTVSSHQQNASTHRGRGRPRKSDISVASNSGTPVTASRKRKSMEGANDSMISNPDEQVQSSPAQLAIKALRQAQQEDPPATGDTFVPQMDDQPGNSTNEDRHTTIDAEQTETRESTISAEPPIEEEPEEEEAPPPKKRSKRGARLSSKRKQAAPSQRAREKSHQPSAYRPSESADPDGNGRRGPKSLVSLRAGTPLEDSGRNVTRSGRVSVKPLKYWCNETFIWRNGEVDGIVRAEEVEEPKKKPMRKGGRRRGGSRLGSVPEEEEEDDEDLLPEKWEEELGVINGRVRSWDAELGAGSVEEEVDEDVAFASSSIAVRDVQGSAFKYAKVMTLPFFGSGMVEIPPGGYKRTKNSRKMQMVFFVHEGKVTVEVAGLTFGLTKGGVWQVPRGNNYSITNESEQHTAKIFFAQGCETDPAADEEAPAA
ncbi:mitotic fidelity of chromosome transmission- protein [Taxawa tesnikishii (nom. ined.)]|nr:mitotic fidelity of chromosome transmission- protein [Dothideales sp. JES 119]